MPASEKQSASFADRLNEAMSIRDMKAVDLVKKTGLTKQQISHYRKGMYEAKQQGIYALSKALDVSEAWLMGFDVPMERTPDDERIAPIKKRDLSIEERANQILSGLMDDEGDTLMLDGQAASPEAVEAFKSAIEMGVELARRVNKDKAKGKTNNEDDNKD